MVEKAKLIEAKKYCDVCLLIEKAEDKSIKFYCYKEGSYFHNEPDQYVCEDCLKGLREIRKMCILKADNPKHIIFKDFKPWFIKNNPELEKKMTGTKTIENF